MEFKKSLISKSGKAISLLVIETSKFPILTVIETHGGTVNSKEKTAAASSELIQYCQKNNINYLAIDLSNNGSQKDQPLDQLRFSHRFKDLESAIDFVIKTYNSSIVLLGSSLGGFVTLNNALYSPFIKGIILNCPAIKAHECVRDTMDKQEFDNWKDVGTTNVWGVPMTYDFYADLVANNAMKTIPEIKIPLLIFHGTEDKTVPIAQVREAKSINPSIELIEVKGGGHRFGDKMKKEEWENIVENFIAKISYSVLS